MLGNWMGWNHPDTPEMPWWMKATQVFLTGIILYFFAIHVAIPFGEWTGSFITVPSDQLQQQPPPVSAQG